jgi:hypothetical protein
MRNGGGFALLTGNCSAINLAPVSVSGEIMCFSANEFDVLLRRRRIGMGATWTKISDRVRGPQTAETGLFPRIQIARSESG